MNKRPLSITILAWVFIAVGSVGVVVGLLSLFRVARVAGFAALNRRYLIDTGFVLLSGLIAAISGAALLHRFRWARWVCIGWIVAHVVLSIWHSAFEVVAHSVMLAGMIYILFRREASTYFHLSETG